MSICLFCTNTKEHMYFLLSGTLTDEVRGFMSRRGIAIHGRLCTECAEYLRRAGVGCQETHSEIKPEEMAEIL